MLGKLFSNDRGFVLILLALSVLFFWKVVANPDQIIYSPVSDFVKTELFFGPYVHDAFSKFGQIALWNNIEYAGFPLAGETSFGLFYPIDLILLFTSGETLFGFIFLLDVFLAGLFMYFFLRVIRLEKTSSLIGAIAFMFSGFILTKVYAGHYAGINTFIWFPLLLAFTELYIRKKDFKFAILTGIVFAIQILSAHVQYAAYGFTFFTLYLILRFIFDAREKKEKISKLAKPFLKIFLTMLILGFSISAVQLFPQIETSQLSGRASGASFDFASYHSMNPIQAISLVLPEIFGGPEIPWGFTNFWEFSIYIGIISLFFSLVAIIFTRNKFVLIFLILAAFSLLFAFGKYTPLFYIFYKLVPGFNLFRIPAKFLIYFVFSLATLSAYGANVFFSQKFDRANLKRLTFVFLIASILISGSVFLFTVFPQLTKSLISSALVKLSSSLGLAETQLGKINFALDNIDFVYSVLMQQLFLIAVLISVSTLLFVARERKFNMKLLKIFVVLLLVSDLFLWNAKYIDTRPADFVLEHALLDNLETGLYRVYSLNDTFQPQVAVQKQVGITDGYSPVLLGSYEKFLQKFSCNSLCGDVALQLLNVKYVTSTSSMSSESLNLISVERGMYLYENKNFLERAFVAYSYQTAKDPFTAMREKSFNPKSTVVLETQQDFEISDKGEFEISFEKYSPNEVTVKVKNTEPGFLVLLDSYHPGWRAFVDQREAKIYKADGAFRAVFVNAGTSEVTFVYDSLSIRIGSIVLFLAMVFVAFYFLNYYGLLKIILKNFNFKKTA